MRIEEKKDKPRKTLSDREQTDGYQRGGGWGGWCGEKGHYAYDCHRYSPQRRGRSQSRSHLRSRGRRYSCSCSRSRERRSRSASP
uniref:Uncharacterized protein n=1 Tax=Ailuropoda melanoleuca TaxID=9646 RepID=A0A7N5P7L7_AILME